MSEEGKKESDAERVAKCRRMWKEAIDDADDKFIDSLDRLVSLVMKSTSNVSDARAIFNMGLSVKRIFTNAMAMSINDVMQALGPMKVLMQEFKIPKKPGNGDDEEETVH